MPHFRRPYERERPMKRRFLPAFLITALSACAHNPPAGVVTSQDTVYRPGQYRVFNGAGAPATLDQIAQAMTAQQVVFIGETHDDPTGHMLERELLERAAAGASRRPVALSLEFFERDVQPL